MSFEEKEALVNKLKRLGLDGDVYDEKNRKAIEEFEEKLTPEERSILKTLQGRRMVRPEDSLNIDNFTLDSIDGLAPRLERGRLGLTAAKRASLKYTAHDSLSFLNGEARAANKLEVSQNGNAAPRNGTNSITDGHTAPVNGNSTHITNETNGTNGIEGIEGLAELMAKEAQPQSSSLDETSRHRLMSSLHESAEELETPHDTMLRFVNAVRP